jgi:hypothetical protein
MSGEFEIIKKSKSDEIKFDFNEIVIKINNKI